MHLPTEIDMEKRNVVYLLGLVGVLVGFGPWWILWGVSRLVLWLHPLPPYTQCTVEGGDTVSCIQENVNNWAENVNLGKVTVFYPTTLEELTNVVKTAKVSTLFLAPTELW